jgi:hypothetical protein
MRKRGHFCAVAAAPTPFRVVVSRGWTSWRADQGGSGAGIRPDLPLSRLPAAVRQEHGARQPDQP